jgi:hypothetical protein
MRIEILDAHGTVVVRQIDGKLEFTGGSVRRLEQRGGGLVTVHCGRAPANGPPGYAALAYYSHKDPVQSLRLCARDASLTFFGLAFASQLQLELRCVRSQVNLSTCKFDNLQLRSESEACSLDLCDYQPALRQLEAELTGTALSGVQLSGCGRSRVDLRSASSLCMFVAGETECVEFNRDASSRAKVHLSDSSQREMRASYERWYWTDSELSQIILRDEEAAVESDSTENESPSPEDCCVICRSARADCRLEPCQHLCLCAGCLVQAGRQMQQPLGCPLCRAQVVTAQLLVS